MSSNKQGRKFTADDVQERMDMLGHGDHPEDNNILAAIATYADMEASHPITVASIALDIIRADMARQLLSEEAVGSIVASHKGFIWSWQEYDGDPDSLGWNDDSWAKEYVRDLCAVIGIDVEDDQP